MNLIPIKNESIPGSNKITWIGSSALVHQFPSVQESINLLNFEALQQATNFYDELRSCNNTISRLEHISELQQTHTENSLSIAQRIMTGLFNAVFHPLKTLQQACDYIEYISPLPSYSLRSEIYKLQKQNQSILDNTLSYEQLDPSTTSKRTKPLNTLSNLTSTHDLWLDAYIKKQTTPPSAELLTQIIGHANPAVGNAQINNENLEGGSHLKSLHFQIEMMEALIDSLESLPSTYSTNQSTINSKLHSNELKVSEIEQIAQKLKLIVKHLKTAVKIEDIKKLSSFLAIIYGNSDKFMLKHSFANSMIKFLEVNAIEYSLDKDLEINLIKEIGLDNYILDIEKRHQANFGKFCDYIQNKILSLNDQDLFILPGRWKTKTSGHATYWEVKKQPNGKLTVRHYNSGDGLQYHTSKTYRHKTYYLPFVELTDVVPHDFTSHAFLKGYWNIQVTNPQDKLPEWDKGDIYRALIYGLGGEISSKTYCHSDLKAPQSIGNCIMESQMIPIENLLGGNTVARLYRTFATLKTLHAYFQANKDLLNDDVQGEEQRRLLHDGIRALAARALVSFKDGTLPEEELNYISNHISEMTVALTAATKKASSKFGQSITPVDLSISKNSISLEPFLKIDRRSNIDIYFTEDNSVEIRLPRLGLRFKIVEKNDKRQAVCQELPGYILKEGPTHHIAQLSDFYNYLPLTKIEEDGSEKQIVIIPRLPLEKYTKGSYKTNTLPDYWGTNNIKYFVYDVVKERLVPKSTINTEIIEANLYLTMIHLSEKSHFTESHETDSLYLEAHKALKTVDTMIMEQLVHLNTGSIEILKWIITLDEKTLDNHPEAAAIQLKALTILKRNGIESIDGLNLELLTSTLKRYAEFRTEIDRSLLLTDKEEADLEKYFAKDDIELPDNFKHHAEDIPIDYTIGEVKVKPLLTASDIVSQFTENFKGPLNIQWAIDLVRPKAQSKNLLLRDIDLLSNFIDFYAIVKADAAYTKNFPDFIAQSTKLLNQKLALNLDSNTMTLDRLRNELKVALKIHASSCLNQKIGNAVWPSVVLLAASSDPDKFMEITVLEDILNELNNIIIGDTPLKHLDYTKNGLHTKESIGAFMRMLVDTFLKESEQTILHELYEPAIKMLEDPQTLGLVIPVADEIPEIESDQCGVKVTRFKTQPIIDLNFSKSVRLSTLPMPSKVSFRRPFYPSKSAEFLSMKPSYDAIASSVYFYSNRVEERKSDLLALAHKDFDSLGMKAKRTIEQLTGKYKSLTIDELVRCYYHLDYEWVHQRNQALTQQEIVHLFVNLQEYLLDATHLKQQQNILKIAENIKDVLKSNEDFNVGSMEFKLVYEASRKRAYNVRDFPEFLIFEYYSGKLLEYEADYLQDKDREERLETLNYLAREHRIYHHIAPLGM